MIRANSKKARENVKKYITDNFDCSSYDVEEPENFSDMARMILDTFRDEKMKHDKRRMTEYELFIEWCSGLPSMLDTCYYNRSAVKDLAGILEETEEESSKYTEEQAENRLTYMIYSELKRAI